MTEREYPFEAATRWPHQTPGERAFFGILGAAFWLGVLVLPALLIHL